MLTDSSSSPPVDPRIREALQLRRLQSGPHGPLGIPQDVGAETDAAWQALEARMADPAGPLAHGTRRVRKGVMTSRSWVGIAVALLCVIGLTTALMSRSDSDVPATHYQTAGGQVSRVVLPDGTVMTLAPATSVAVSRTRDGNAVDVDGEAYFNVSSSARHPFVVRTGNAVVQVLGTAFSVRRYASEARTQVVVEEGKVAVRTQRHGVVSDVPMAMTARMVAQVTDSGVSVTPVSDTRAFTGWRDGRLVFDNAPVRDVVAELGRYYNTAVRVEGNDLANERLILEVAIRRQSLSQALDLVGVATNAHVRRDGNVLVLVPGRDVATPRDRPRQTIPQPEKLYGR